MGGIIVDSLQKSLAWKLSSFKISNARINELAKSIFVEGIQHARLDICPYGICLDYVFDRSSFFDEVGKFKGLRRIDVFPHGIPAITMYRAHLEVEVPELTAAAHALG